ncbi:MAG TPA: heavy metal sensor histidine kinase [Pseudacidobacterium sp.]|nr:heavy metal sensor histidine kinase [Pseudacidobacterium sp.]
MNHRSLRVRLSILYIVFSSATMVALGAFSYWFLDEALASSRQQTMGAREERFIRFVNEWPQSASDVPLAERLHQLNLVIAPSDTIQVHEMDGKTVYSSPGPSYFKSPWPEKDCSQRCYGLIMHDGHPYRILDHIATLQGRQYRIFLCGRIDEHIELLEAIRNSYLFLCPLMLLISAGAGFVLSGRALEPIARITAEARDIGIHDLKRRIPVPKTGDELQLLAETWNQLLARLESAVEQLTQFTSDISHDLSTTITIMMTTTGLALSRDRSPQEYRSALHSINVECEATAQLLDTLLAIARADRIDQKIEWKTVNLTEVVEEVSQQFEPRAVVKNQTINLHVESGVSINGDLSLLRRMLSILVDNAIKYTPEKGSIGVSLAAKEDCVKLQVSDTGIGIPAYALPKIFDRFYRVDESRTGSGESNGLGLAIAKWVAEAHHSTIDVVSAPGQGSTFTVSIPRMTYHELPEVSCVPAA